MRLRQIALASHRLDAVVQALGQVFGLRVAYNDPHIGVYGLRNAVLPAGDGFVEVVEPVTASASAARFLARRGGDAGYMVLLQVADAEAEAARAEALGVRIVDRIRRPDYACAHFHPADFGGVLVSFDQQRDEPDPLAPLGRWMPAGPDWQRARSDQVLALRSATLSTPDPLGLARRWSHLLARPLADGAAQLALDRGEIRFAPAPADAPNQFSAVTLQVRDRAAVLREAVAAGLDVTADGVLIGGLRWQPVD